MASYSVFTKHSAAKELAGLTLSERRHVVERIEALSMDPKPRSSEKLSGQEKYRIRQCDLRVLYAIDDRDATVTIVNVGHRRDVYR